MHILEFVINTVFFIKLGGGKTNVIVFSGFSKKIIIEESSLFQREMVALEFFGLCICDLLSMWWFPSTTICPTSSGTVLMNCWRSPLYWSLIFCKTYKILCYMWCVMRDVQDLIFCKIYQIGVSADLLMIFQNLYQVEVVCTQFLARSHI